MKARGTINQVKGGSSGNSVNAISFLDLGSTKALCQVAFSSNGFDILGQKCGFTEAELGKSIQFLKSRFLIFYI